MAQVGSQASQRLLIVLKYLEDVHIELMHLPLTRTRSDWHPVQPVGEAFMHVEHVEKQAK